VISLPNPGEFTDSNEIKILIMYALKALEHPVLFSDLGDVVLCNGVVNYFEYSHNLYELLITGHVDRIKQDKTELYKLTRFGAKALEELWPRLPSSVREKTLKAAVAVLTRHRRESEARCSIGQKGKNWYLTLSILEKEDPLMELKILVPNKLQAELICKRFQENPAQVYSQILFAALGVEPPEKLTPDSPSAQEK
jgi:hypothetical protein